jgi:hypothetical protein
LHSLDDIFIWVSEADKELEKKIADFNFLLYDTRGKSQNTFLLAVKAFWINDPHQHAKVAKQRSNS